MLSTADEQTLFRVAATRFCCLDHERAGLPVVAATGCRRSETPQLFSDADGVHWEPTRVTIEYRAVPVRVTTRFAADLREQGRSAVREQALEDAKLSTFSDVPKHPTAADGEVEISIDGEAVRGLALSYGAAVLTVLDQEGGGVVAVRWRAGDPAPKLVSAGGELDLFGVS